MFSYIIQLTVADCYIIGKNEQPETHLMELNNV